MHRCADCATRAHCLAADAPSAALPELSALLATTKVLQPGDHLYRLGDAANQHYYVRSGAFKTFTIASNGEERITGFFLPGDVLSTTSCQGQRMDGAIALTTATACCLQNDDIVQLAALGCLPRYIAKQAERETRLIKHQLILSNPSALARFARYCSEYSLQLAMLDRNPTRLPLPMSRTDIASYLGMTLASLSRVTSKLARLGTIRSARKEIEVLDPARLAALAGDF